jgi:hypothetical protein
VDINVGGHTLHLCNVHLGTALLERRYQGAPRGDRDAAARGRLKLVLGDFGEWTRGLATTLLSSKLKAWISTT